MCVEKRLFLPFWLVYAAMDIDSEAMLYNLPLEHRSIGPFLRLRAA